MTFTVVLPSGAIRTMGDQGALGLGRGKTTASTQSIALEIAQISDLPSLSGHAVSLTDMLDSVTVTSHQKDGPGEVLIVRPDERTPVSVVEGASYRVRAPEFTVRIRFKNQTRSATFLDTTVTRLVRLGPQSPLFTHDITDSGLGTPYGIENQHPWVQLCAACAVATRLASPYPPQKRIAIQTLNALRNRPSINSETVFEQFLPEALRELSLNRAASLQQISAAARDQQVVVDIDIAAEAHRVRIAGPSHVDRS